MPPATPDNPYQPPLVEIASLVPDEQRLLVASFPVDSALVHRSLQFLAERRIQAYNLGLLLSFVLLLALLAGVFFRMPRDWWLTLVLVFFVHQLLLYVWRSWSVRRQLRRWKESGRWPMRFGMYHVEVTADRMLVRIEHDERQWPLGEIAGAFYLGDLLLIIPQPQVLIPIPRSADFSSDTFGSFSRAFAMRYRPAQQAADSR